MYTLIVYVFFMGWNVPVYVQNVVTADQCVSRRDVIGQAFADAFETGVVVKCHEEEGTAA